MSSEVDSKKDLAVCLNLRCKEMFYKDDDPEAEQHQADVERVYGACDTTAYWCQCTQSPSCGWSATMLVASASRQSIP